MLNSRLEAARAVMGPLRQVKHDAGDALLTGAALLTSIVGAGRAANVSPVLTAKALAKVAAGNAAQAEALLHYAAGHEELAMVRDAIGLREYCVGVYWDCPAVAEQAPARPGTARDRASRPHNHRRKRPCQFSYRRAALRCRASCPIPLRHRSPKHLRSEHGSNRR